MVDVLDDLIREFRDQKKDFFSTVKTMQSMKESGIQNALNAKFTSVGDRLKIRFDSPPIREGKTGDRAKYVVMATDITDADGGDAPTPFILTQFHMQQITRDLLSTKRLNLKQLDKKLKCSTGTVWDVMAVENYFKGENAKEFMLEFNIIPEESVLNTEEVIKEVQAEESKLP